MKGRKGLHDQEAKRAQDLRRRAEEQAGKYDPEAFRDLTKEEASRLIHELRVHQLELDMQNQELRQAQEELEASRARYFDLYDLAPVGYCTLNEKGLIHEANLTMATLLGTTRSSLLKQPFGSLYVMPEDQDIYYRHRKLLYETGEPQVWEMWMLRIDRPPFWARAEATISRDADGESKVLVCIQDVTSLKQAEQEREKLLTQLLQDQKMKSIGILAGGVAHDFNNLLQTMSGNLEMLMHDKSPGHPDFSRLQGVSRSVKSAARLVQQLLLVGRKAKFQKVRVDLNNELHKIHDVLGRVIPKMVAIDLQLAPCIWPIAADPAQIEQVLLNLANNAVDAMPQGGRLEFKTGNVVLDEDFVRRHPEASPGPHILLSVTDTGCGMDSETRKYVFDPFFTTKETGKGSGLGLASVYGIVNVHGGYIQCYSAPGQGTIFEIFLPAQEGDTLPCEKSAPDENARGGKETILVVEDEPAIQELMMQALRTLGYESKVVSSGEEALDMYKKHGSDIDLVLLDLSMPGMGGYKCLQELRRLDPGVKVIIVSGYGANAEDILHAGAKDYIGKPYQINQLASKIREVLDAD